MSDGTQQISYRNSLDILSRHGLIILLLYWMTEIASWLSVGHWLRALPKLAHPFRFAFNVASNTVKPWWQDTIFLFTLLLLTPLVVTVAWSPFPYLALLGPYASWETRAP
jgi:hypothetical protein